jgi:hypothetical protein
LFNVGSNPPPPFGLCAMSTNPVEAEFRIDRAWLDWQLRGDAEAAKMFTGENCGLCRDPAWQFASKSPHKGKPT